MMANDLIGRFKRLAARLGWQIRKGWGSGSRGGPAAEDYAPMEEDPNSEIDIHVIDMHRDLSMQRRTGLYTGSMNVQVVHTLGSFELTFQTEQAERLPHTDTEILEFARRKVVQFADLLKVARIQIAQPSPDQHSALTSVNAVHAEIIGFVAREGSNEVCLTLKLRRGSDQRFLIEAGNLVGFAQRVRESFGDKE
jgi:hypothetical protein